MNRILVMRGGLGNQMLQFALLYVLRKKGYNVTLDISYYDFLKMHNGYELERVFGIKEKTISKKGTHLLWLRALNKYRPACLVSFDNLKYSKNVLLKPRRYIYGWWFDERYFLEHSIEIKKLFAFCSIDEINLKLGNEISSCNSVSVHIRRGDYASFGMKIIGEDYYKKAINIINSRIDNPVFYVFSDDRIESKELMDKLHVNYIIVDNNVGENSYKDMYLMSKCKYNIIANSSFSWWGAWLNDNPEKIVISPEIWEDKKRDFKPQVESWIKI